MENIASVKCIVIRLKWRSGRVIETSSTKYFGGLQNFCLQTMPRTFLSRFWSVDFQPHLFCQVKSAQERTFKPAKFKPLYVTNPRLGLITCWSMGQKLRLFESSIVFSSVILLVTACNHFFFTFDWLDWERNKVCVSMIIVQYVYSLLHIAVMIKLWIFKVCFKHALTLKQVDPVCLHSLGWYLL